ncbi:MAG: hypothetical protein SGBAC_000451 [Bacillariaceae sp.]
MSLPDESEPPEVDSQDSRGQKRPLEEAEGDNGEDEKNDKKYDLPQNVLIKWNGHNAVVAIDCRGGSDLENRICIVGRGTIQCLQGSLHILGHAMQKEENDNAGAEVVVTSPFWSSWTTIQATTPIVRFQVSSLRGTPSFRFASASRRPTIIPASWITSADTIVNICHKEPAPQRDSLEDDRVFVHDKPQIIFICGGKGVGKSTFLRYLTNRLLSSKSHEEVAILDADVGQPELVPPGILSCTIQKTPLLQPPYWNLTESKDSIASVFYGAVSSKDDPVQYIEAIHYLVQAYRDHLKTTSNRTPLLINMDGWIKGLGYEILTSLALSVGPTHVCQILGSSKAKTFDLQSTLSGKESTIYFLDACTNLISMSCHIPSFTLRSLRLGTYFGSHLTDLWDTLDFTPAKQLQGGWIDDGCILAEHLAQERPYCVPFEAIKCSFLSPDHDDLMADEKLVLQAMNGAVVGLCIGDANNCLGLGLVRSIDWKSELLYVLTPVEASALPQVDTLVGGNLPLPLSFVFRGVHAESFPYQSMTNPVDVTALGVDPMKSRNNIGRKGNMNGGN